MLMGLNVIGVLLLNQISIDVDIGGRGNIN